MIIWTVCCNIGARISMVRLQLSSFLSTAHGHPFKDLEGRAQAIKEHHHERLDELRNIAEDIGTGDVNSFMKRLGRNSASAASPAINR